MDNIEESLEKWCNAEGIRFKSAEAEETYKQRVRRVADVIQLKVPDRVPIVPSFGMFPALDNGFTVEEVMFDYDKAHKAWTQTVIDYEPDLFLNSSYAFSGHVLETLDYKPLRLPGRGISPNHIYQFVEGEYATEEFYDAFIADPFDYVLRTHMPRVCGALEPLGLLRPGYEMFGYYISIIRNLIPLGRPEVAAAIEIALKAGQEALKWAKGIGSETQEIMSMGFPIMNGGASATPFDIIGDWFRGTRGIMLDMYRRPDKLIETMERLVPILIRMGADQSRRDGNPIVSLMLHKGPDGFMSLEQFKTFYWPTLRKVMVGLIEEGCVPMPLFEGNYTSRLEIIKDIPEKKAIYWFETVDIRQAKEVLGDIACFRGNVPVTLLYAGTTQQVKDYVKELIDVVGDGGGLMVDCGIWFDEAKRENVKAMVDFTKEYGVYR